MRKGSAITIIVILSVVTAAAVGWSWMTMKKNGDAERSIAASYRHAFSEVVSGAEELDATLQKSVYVTSPSITGTVCAEIYAKAQTTGMALGVLPFSAAELEKTLTFINSVGNYAFALTQKAGRGESLTEEDRQSLKALSKTASSMYASLKAIEDELGSEMAGINEYRRSLREYDEREGAEVARTVADNMSLAEEEFPEMPHLIYDGPFSEHLKNASPKLLEGKEVISESEGRKIAATFIGVRPEQVYPIAQQAGALPAFCYETEVNGEYLNICVTKRGGQVCSLLNSRQVLSMTLTVKEGVDAARRLLERWGYSNMRESYYAVSNNILTANFAYEQDGVLCYPDLIHVGIALDNGSLQCFEATGYVFSHTQRELPVAQLTAEQAREEKVPPELSVLSEQAVVIPSPGKHELFCYEFVCEEPEGRKYIIYVNAVTGEQEKILILLEDESGALTM